ncbi:MAG: 30S ribosomal protein S8 [Patescibacteria group bacterium]
MTDPVGDFIIRIKNAVMARHDSVRVQHSKLNQALAEILKQEGYIKELGIDESVQFPELVLNLRYVGKQPAVTDVRRLSKPGRRLYSPSKTIPRALGGYGITIVSTNKGVMTDTQARKLNVGGELLCQIW